MTLTPPQLPEGVQPPTDEQLAEYALARDAQNAYIEAKEQAEADRVAMLAAPIVPLPVDGSTVDEIKASAETAISDLATQMQAKIDAILGGV